MMNHLQRQLISLVLLTLTLSSVVTASTIEPQDLRQRLEASTGETPLVAGGVVLKSEAALRNFYLERGFEPAWHRDGQPTPQALAVIATIGDAANDGLLPEDYHYSALRAHYLREAHEVGRSGNHTDYDLLLSDAVVNLSQHLLAGKVDPETLSPEWKAQRRQRDVLALLRGVVEADDVAARINELRPNQVRYFRLRKLLAQLRTGQLPDWPALDVYPTIKPQSRDARVDSIRQRLIYWGDLPADSDTTETSVYDEPLLTAVKKFQRRHSLEEDGIIGRQTLEALNVSPAQRRQQVINNLERWRWLAEDLGENHVLVNIAGFELKMVENNQTVAKKPVIVGRDYRRTPVFSDRIRYIVFNPTWTVPVKLAVKDKLPDIRNDPSYLARMGFTVFDREQKVVDPTTVDWNSISGRGFPFRLVQAPGPQNALGQVKFMFPNQYDVYLHDTPGRELFAKNDRAFSSGCVRVSDPMELASWLLRANGLDRAAIDAIVAKGEIQTVFLKQPVPVHIEYWTAWIDRQGELNFRNDIYHRDPPLAEALATPLYSAGESQ